MDPDLYLEGFCGYFLTLLTSYFYSQIDKMCIISRKRIKYSGCIGISRNRKVYLIFFLRKGIFQKFLWLAFSENFGLRKDRNESIIGFD